MTDVEKVLIVTGGGRGIGAATARTAAARGFKVAVNYHNSSEAAASVVEDIRSSGGVASAVRADVGKAGEVARLFASVEGDLGPVAALVNNAGIAAGHCRVDALDPEALRRVLEVNVMGCFLCAAEAVRRMSAARGGRGGAIVNVSSQAARFGGESLAHYAASKAAVDAFTLSLAREVAKEGIRVNAVSPGVIHTDQYDLSDPLRVKDLESAIPLGRIGAPEEVAEAILWLISEQASYVTGTILPVAGGR